MSTLIHRNVPALMKRRGNQSGRDADARRTIPLNSSQWQKLREVVLAREPLCRHCADRLLNIPATDVDHISGDPSDNRMKNLQGLCHECHSRKTAVDHGKTARYGCDSDGIPLGTRHHWNVAPQAATQGADALPDEKSPATDSARPASKLFFNAKSEDSTL